MKKILIILLFSSCISGVIKYPLIVSQVTQKQNGVRFVYVRSGVLQYTLIVTTKPFNVGDTIK